MKEVEWVVFDVEGDDLYATKIYCLSYKDHKGDVGTVTDYSDIRDFFYRYAVYVGHNIRRWDIPTLQRVCGVDIPDGVRIVDTLGVAWYLEPLRQKHNLESYGEYYGVKKPHIFSWREQSLEDYIFRCEQDVEINHLLWKDQLRYLHMLYPDWDDLWALVGYLDFKLYCAMLAEESRWKFDHERCETVLRELERQRDEKFEQLAEAMPPVPIERTYLKPKRYRNADGQLSVLGQRWQERLIEAGLPEDHDGPVVEVVGYERGNPASHSQIKSWLYGLGWQPQTFKHQRNKKTGELKSIPQINKEHGGGICDSIKKLYEIEPRLELLDGLSILNHRISILAGFLRDEDEDHHLSARIAGFTNTLRFKHAELVNLPKPEKPYGDVIRGVLICEDDEELCGSDMAGVEDRIKQHYLYDYDPDYVAKLNREDYDPHLDIAVLAGMMTEEDSDFYKKFNSSVASEEEHKRYKTLKGIRALAKNANYACQYGAGASRLAITAGISKEDAEVLHQTYWRLNWAIKAVAADQEIKELPSFDGEETQLWLLNPVSGFWYSLRTQKDVFSTLVQGTAAFVFDLWVRFIVTERPQLTGQFHDEIILRVKKGHQEEVKEFLKDCIGRVNETLQLNRELDIDVQFGSNYAEIH